MSKHDNISTVVLKKKRVFNKCLGDTEYVLTSLFERKPRKLRHWLRHRIKKEVKERERGREKEIGDTGFDISLSVDRKLKLPVGSNEISNYP